MFASWSSIYGNADVPVKHEALPLSPYALQKYGGERYAQLFHQLYGFETVSLRSFNIFGPRQAFHSHYSSVIAKFCDAMLADQTPVIFGDGSQARDFTFVKNAVHANPLTAETPAEKGAGKVFNFAWGDSISLIRLVKDLNMLTGRHLEPRFQRAA
jgi:nucleoside-diphosphate-sugar epimerase